MHLSRLAAIAVLAAAPALAQDMTMTPDNTLTAPPEAWLGATPHFVMMGKVNGHDLDIQYLDIATAAGVAEFQGKREYLAGDPAPYGDFEVALKAVIDGIERSIELEFENADFRAHTLPATFTLQDTNFPAGPLAFLEVELEWEAHGLSVNDEVGAMTGTLVLSLDEGTADDKGLMGDGFIGGHVVAEAGGERVVVSFTVPVVEYEVDD